MRSGFSSAWRNQCCSLSEKGKSTNVDRTGCIAKWNIEKKQKQLIFSKFVWGNILCIYERKSCVEPLIILTRSS